MLVSCLELTGPSLLLGQERAVDFYRRACGEEQRNELENALADYTRTIELAPKYADAYIGRGNVQARKGGLDDALADYNHAIEINPQSTLAYINRARVKYRRSDWD